MTAGKIPLHNSADHVKGDTEYGFFDALNRDTSIQYPHRMDVGRSFKAQVSLVEFCQTPIKGLNDHIEGGIYDDGDDFGRLNGNLGANYIKTIINSSGMPT